MADGNQGKGKVVITYGTFDLFHYGHEALLRRAKELGDYLIVGVTSDAFDRSRGKLNVKQSLIERIKSVENTGLADKIIVEEFKGQKIDDIRKYNVDIFALGSDWVGKFDYLEEYCDVVYLPRTQGVSSTELRRMTAKTLRLGCIGTGIFTDRMIREASYVSNVRVLSVVAADADGLKADSTYDQYKSAESFEELADIVDAVYVNTKPALRPGVLEKALEAGLHVISEGPIAFTVEDVKRLQKLAADKGLVLIEALTAMYLPGFQRLKLLLESGIVGEIKDIDASYSIVPDSLDFRDRYSSNFYNMSSRTLLPALVYLGAKPKDVQVICGYEQDMCTWSKYNLLFETASATLKTGRGVKTEGDMTITGTDGYIYVPAPWWRLEYFEIRNEDLRDVKKHYYECAGEGQRYLIKEFYLYWSDPAIYDMAKGTLEELEVATVGIIERIGSDQCITLANHSSRFGGGENV
ncbi:MAG: adenylyltransferase/cytidyltransferase family protein [Eggerthellaceae bacterium]|nr:adenylyltransferase/cytidyltransferase family protein [Eggerthellaceae bacterium]